MASMNLIELVFPPRCIGCHAHLEADERRWAVCRRCQPAVFEIESPRCPKCSLPREVKRGIDELCVDCATQRRGFERVDALWEYAGVIADALQAAKYGGRIANVRSLAELSAPWFSSVLGALPGQLRITTVPVHPADLVRRGYDVPRMYLSCLPANLRRALHVEEPLAKVARRRAQASLTRAERLNNTRRAFALRKGVDARGSWLVFDDVMTTGATMQAVARCLRRAGADAVYGAVLARTP